ncbi:hypothetical protein L7F22_002837 [Adiantum nelumboides]|nr:hypothetical protein [Adiantum nelumboides]
MVARLHRMVAALRLRDVSLSIWKASKNALNSLSLEGVQGLRQAAPSQAGSSFNGFRNRERPQQDRRRDDRRNFQRDITIEQHASTSSAPSTSQSSRQELCTICNGNHTWYECPKRPNPSTTGRNTNMESCPETEQCSTSHSDKGKQAIRAVRVSKVVSALMLNVNTNVSVPINLSNQVLSLLGFIGKHPLNLLVDSGCSTNFVSTTLISKLRLPTQQSVEAFQVELADGSYLQCNKKSWLYQYDPIISFRDHSIRLYHDNQELELRGLLNTQPITMVSAMQVKRLDVEDDEDDDDTEDQPGTSEHNQGPDDDDNQDDPPSGSGLSTGGAANEPSNPRGPQSQPPPPAPKGNKQDNKGATNTDGGQKQKANEVIIPTEGSNGVFTYKKRHKSKFAWPSQM